MVEELLRYEPPVQMLTGRSTPADIDLAGTTIPKGAPLALVLAAGDRDPDRTDNQHLGFGSGIHYCYGPRSPGSRRRSHCPRWPADWCNPGWSPTRHLTGPALRGPRHLFVDIDAIAPAAEAAIGVQPRERVPRHRVPVDGYGNMASEASVLV
ncbi:cytochrome P450 [Streptosporangium sp. NPDC002544]|uniref:cytochrome P450 n=1 Tax=Streptosporangium sp. NPDC002544 TaxID=3154538 RepID=UPI00332DA90F